MPALTQKSQVTVPKNIREILGIGPGDEIDFEVQGKKILIHRTKKESIIEKYKGFLGKGDTEKVMATLR
mgnify:CR=1 FL=1|tara:strand:- start:21 stop:227 length:207 start_codon:yes stop_codon:yes gene_type:complete